MVYLLTYLAGLPYHGSPLMFSTWPRPTRPRNPSTLMLGGLHPLLEGRGQVAASLGVDGPKNDRGNPLHLNGAFWERDDPNH